MPAYLLLQSGGRLALQSGGFLLLQSQPTSTPQDFSGGVWRNRRTKLREKLETEQKPVFDIFEWERQQSYVEPDIPAPDPEALRRAFVEQAATLQTPAPRRKAKTAEVDLQAQILDEETIILLLLS